MQAAYRPRPSIHIHPAPYGNFQFPHSSRKRKRSSSSSSDEEPQPINLSTISPIKSRSPSADDSDLDHRIKRTRRAPHLEKGMHGMSLRSRLSSDGSLKPIMQEPVAVPAAPVNSGYQPQQYFDQSGYYVTEPELLAIDEEFMPRADLDQDDDSQSILDEIFSPAVKGDLTQDPDYVVKDAKMKGTSWYEPEKDRIIITELSSSDSDEEDAAGQSEAPTYWDEADQSYKPFKVSSAYFAKFGRMPRNEPMPTEDSRALVMYRPVVQKIDLTQPSDLVQGTIEEVEDPVEVDDQDMVQVDDDPMDIDME